MEPFQTVSKITNLPKVFFDYGISPADTGEKCEYLNEGCARPNCDDACRRLIGHSRKHPWVSLCRDSNVCCCELYQPPAFWLWLCDLRQISIFCLRYVIPVNKFLACNVPIDLYFSNAKQNKMFPFLHRIKCSFGMWSASGQLSYFLSYMSDFSFLLYGFGVNECAPLLLDFIHGCVHHIEADAGNLTSFQKEKKTLLDFVRCRPKWSIILCPW